MPEVLFVFIIISVRFKLTEIVKINFIISYGYRIFKHKNIFIIIIIIIWFVRLLALRPLLAYCASLGW
jgi:hypothetical protein